MLDFKEHLPHTKTPNSFHTHCPCSSFPTTSLWHMSVSMVSDCDQNSLNGGTKHLPYSSKNSTQRHTHPKQRAKIQPWHQSHVQQPNTQHPKQHPKIQAWPQPPPSWKVRTLNVKQVHGTVLQNAELKAQKTKTCLEETNSEFKKQELSSKTNSERRKTLSLKNGLGTTKTSFKTFL